MHTDHLWDPAVLKGVSIPWLLLPSFWPRGTWEVPLSLSMCQDWFQIPKDIKPLVQNKTGFARNLCMGLCTLCLEDTPSLTQCRSHANSRYSVLCRGQLLETGSVHAQYRCGVCFPSEGGWLSPEMWTPEPLSQFSGPLPVPSSTLWQGGQFKGHCRWVNPAQWEILKGKMRMLTKECGDTEADLGWETRIGRRPPRTLGKWEALVWLHITPWSP
jgi:hypothetical protein